MRKKWTAAALAASATALLPLATASAQVEVIVSEIGPTSNVGVAGRAVDSMFNFSVSPDGSWWAGEFNLDGDTNTDAIHLRGQGLSVLNVIWQEDTTVIPGGAAGNFDEGFKARQTDVNNNGIVFGTAESTLTTPDEFIYRFDGTSLTIVAAQGDPVPGVPGETYGTVIDSPTSLLSGQGAWRATTDPNLPTTSDDFALTNNGTTVVAQEGVSIPLGQAGGATETLQLFDANDYYVNASNTMFLYQGDLSGASTTTDDVVVFGAVGTPGTVVLQEGSTLPGLTGTIDLADQIFLAGNHWVARADQQSLGPDFIVRDGVVLAQEGDVAPNGALYTEHSAVTVDENGNVAWIWDTDLANLDTDEILVYNGTTILLTEGDVIQFDQGSGPAPAVVDTFQANDIVIGGNYVYLMVGLDDLAGVSIGDAFIRVQIPEPGSLSLLAGAGLLALRRRRRA